MNTGAKTQINVLIYHKINEQHVSGKFSHYICKIPSVKLDKMAVCIQFLNKQIVEINFQV